MIYIILIPAGIAAWVVLSFLTIYFVSWLLWGRGE